MNLGKKLCALGLSVVMAFSSFGSIEASAHVVDQTQVLAPTNEMIEALDDAAQMLANGNLSEEEYFETVLNIYGIEAASGANDGGIFRLFAAQADDYYDEVKCSYIDADGVKYLYNEVVPNQKTVAAAIAILAAMRPETSWGLSAVALLSSRSGYSPFEKAVQQAYYSGKGLAIYVKIHKSITSLNKYRYVPE